MKAMATSTPAMRPPPLTISMMRGMSSQPVATAARITAAATGALKPLGPAGSAPAEPGRGTAEGGGGGEGRPPALDDSPPPPCFAWFPSPVADGGGTIATFCEDPVIIAHISKRKSAVRRDGDAGGKIAFVARQVDGDGSHLLGGAEPAHRLARHEHLVRLLDAAHLLAERLDALFQRGRQHGAGADGVAADAAPDEVGGDRFGEPDHRRLGRSIDVTVRDAADRGRARGDVDDGARFAALFG